MKHLLAVLLLAALAVACSAARFEVAVTPPTTWDTLEDCLTSNDSGNTMPADSVGITTIEFSTTGATGPWTLKDTRTATSPYFVSWQAATGTVGWIQVITKSRAGVPSCATVIQKQAVGGKPGKPAAL